MARRIVFAQNAGFQNDPQARLFVDQLIDIDWKHKIFEDRWTGELAGAGPSYEVGFVDGYSSKISERGVIRGADDIAWLRSAIDNQRPNNHPIEVVARIDQLGLKRDGRNGFEIEILTGEDAEAILRTNKRKQYKTTFRELWGPVLILAGAVWLFVTFIA